MLETNTTTALASETEAGYRRCRIAHLHSTLGIYGAERWTFALIKHLDAGEFDSIVVTIGTKTGADSFYHVVSAEGFPAFHIAIPGKLNPRAILRLRQLLVQQGIDILHTHGFKADVFGYLATRNLPVKLVSTIHGWTAHEGIRIRAYEAISRGFLKRFDRVYPLSPALFDYLRQHKFDPSKLHLILNAVDLSPFEFNFRVRHSGDLFALLFAGRICRPKGIFELIHAFAGAKYSAPARLRIAGDGPDRAEAQALCHSLGIADKVEFLGAVASIAPYLKTSSALVLPSHSEGIPRVVMEAFAAGVPVVGTAIAGIQQLVEDEVTGLLVPVGDVEKLARTLERLLEHPELAQRMAINARQVVTTKYSAHRMANDFRQEYRRLCYGD